MKREADAMAAERAAVEARKMETLAFREKLKAQVCGCRIEGPLVTRLVTSPPHRLRLPPPHHPPRRLQMAIQAEDKGWMDRFYADESDKAWGKRQATWDALAAARKGLMADVAGEE